MVFSFLSSVVVSLYCEFFFLVVLASCFSIRKYFMASTLDLRTKIGAVLIRDVSDLHSGSVDFVLAAPPPVWPRSRRLTDD